MIGNLFFANVGGGIRGRGVYVRFVVDAGGGGGGDDEEGGEVRNGGGRGETAKGRGGRARNNSRLGYFV